MRAVKRDLNRILNVLRYFIEQRGYTQLEVQETLGWGRSYISQLLKQHKALRFDQILLVLNVINVDPGEFWAEVYPPHQVRAFNRRPRGRGRGASIQSGTIDSIELQPLRTLLNAVVKTLTDKQLITTEDFEAAVERFK